MVNKKPKIAYLALLLLLVNLVVAACADDTATPSVSTPVKSVTSTPGKNVAAATPAVTQEPTNLSTFRADKDFIFGLAQEPVAFGRTNPTELTPTLPSSGVGLDPANLTDQPSLLITRQIYDTLFEYKPGTMQYQYAPFIKTDGISVSVDGLIYTIKIGCCLKFSDGTPMDAEAMRWNFIRWANTASIYHKGDFNAFRTYFVDLPGFPGYPGILDVDKLEVPESRILIVRLKAPMPSFFQVLAMPQFAIVAPSSFDKAGNFVKPIGSGPYMVDKPYDKSARPEQRFMTLKKNPYYTDEKDPNRLPPRNIETIVLKVLPGNQDGLRALRDKQISATDKIKLEDVPENLNDKEFEILNRPALNISFLGMNQAIAPFDREEVRKAFAYGINTRALVEKYYSGLGKPAVGFLPPASRFARADLKPTAYDPQKAKELLLQAGYSNGINNPIELWMLPVPRSYYPDPGKIADAIIADLSKIGVQVIRKEESSWVPFNANRNSGRYSLYMGGWIGENGDPEEFITRFFGEERKDLGYNNPFLRDLLKDSRKTEQRVAFFSQAQDLIINDMPIIPLAYVSLPIAVRRDVIGYVPSPSEIESWASLSFK